MLSNWTLVITLPIVFTGIFLFGIPIYLFPSIYIFEKISFFDALKKSINFGLPSWGATFGIVFVLGFLSLIIGQVASIPWLIVTAFQGFFSISKHSIETDSSLLLQFLGFLFGIIQSYGVYISLLPVYIGIAFHYFNLKEKNERVSVQLNIQNFEQL